MSSSCSCDLISGFPGVVDGILQFMWPRTRLKSPPRMMVDFEFLLILSSDVFSWSSAYPVSFGGL